MVKPILALTMIALTSSLHACRNGCTDMGCSDQVSGTITTPTGTWQPGSYVITITTEDGSHSCSMNVPEDYPDDGTDTYLPCDPELNNWRGPVFQQDVECTEVVDGNSVSQACVPVPDQYEVHWAIEGTPEAVAIQVERDGVVLADEDFSLEYEKSQPNGKGCSPICHTATADVVLP